MSTEQLAKWLRIAIKQNEHDMILTDEEIREARAALAAHEAEKAQAAPVAMHDESAAFEAWSGRAYRNQVRYTRRDYSMGLAAWLARGTQASAAPAAPVAARTDFLLGGARFKATSDRRQQDARIYGLPRELGGRWVALVAAEDDQHLSLASAAPVAVPLTYGDVVAALKKIAMVARTSGGTPGSDAGLMQACEEAEAVIARHNQRVEASAARWGIKLEGGQG